MIKLMTLHRFTIALVVVSASLMGFVAHGFLLLNEELPAAVCAGAVLLFALVAVHASNQNEDEAVNEEKEALLNFYSNPNNRYGADYDPPIDDDPYPRSHIWL